MGHVRNYTVAMLSHVTTVKMASMCFIRLAGIVFGMPALENAAIKHGVHPKKWTYENIDYMRKELAFPLDSLFRKKEGTASDVLYTKHEQRILLRCLTGLVYQKSATLNWCNTCQTVN